MKKIAIVLIFAFVQPFLFAEPPQEWLDKYNAWMKKYDMVKAIDYGLDGGNLNLFWEKSRSDAEALFLGLSKGWDNYGSDYYGYRSMVNIRINELLVIWGIHRDEGREGLIKAKELYQ
jgi:hypothetical protein